MKPSTTWPRLSETLTGPRQYDRCQACGGEASMTWQECDDHDQPEFVFVRLCRACADQLIEPHPRLYRKISEGEAAPGAMPCCSGCRHRDGLRCRNPLMKFNGGPGVPIKSHQVGWMCSRGKGGGCRPLFGGPPECEGREGEAFGIINT